MNHLCITLRRVQEFLYPPDFSDSTMLETDKTYTETATIARAKEAPVTDRRLGVLFEAISAGISGPRP